MLVSTLSHSDTRDSDYVSPAEVINGVNMDTSLMTAVFKLPGGCTATFLSPRLFITSAHCTTYKDEVRVNGKKAKIINHPKYEPSNFQNGSYRDYYDVSLGVFTEDAIDPSIITAQLCEGAKNPEKMIGRRLLLVGYGCNKWPSRAGGGVKRYGYTNLTILDEDYMGAEDENGGLSCPGDSGGPYFLISPDYSVCHLGTNFYSDRKAKNHATSSINPVVKEFIHKVATEHAVEACGLTMTCEPLYIPAKIREN